ncbi:50S ribosomal protein L31 [Mycolicibacterium flavescens]|nr:50S ribosomal protein L31 [Mycolicibacterium flavescens]
MREGIHPDYHPVSNGTTDACTRSAGQVEKFRRRYGSAHT